MKKVYIFVSLVMLLSWCVTAAALERTTDSDYWQMIESMNSLSSRQDQCSSVISHNVPG